jgi:hypothetical protein
MNVEIQACPRSKNPTASATTHHHIAKMLYVAGWFDQHKAKPNRREEECVNYKRITPQSQQASVSQSTGAFCRCLCRPRRVRI